MKTMEDVRRNTYFMTSIDYEPIDLSGLPPETEPARQQYFIARCRQWVTEKSEELGRPMTCFISTFGCQMNAHDSEKLMGILLEAGFTEGRARNPTLFFIIPAQSARMQISVFTDGWAI